MLNPGTGMDMIHLIQIIPALKITIGIRVLVLIANHFLKGSSALP